MKNRKQVLLQTGQIALGVALCTGMMLGVYDLIGKFTLRVLYGGLAGFALGVLNFFALSVMVNRAADKAEAQDVNAGKVLMQSSYFVRMVVLFLVLVVLAKTGKFDPLAMVIPLAFVRPVITVIELLFKKNSKEETAK